MKNTLNSRFGIPNALIFRAASLLSAALLLIASAITHAGDKIALVIGNDTYDKIGLSPVLDNCASDARLVRDTLTGMVLALNSPQPIAPSAPAMPPPQKHAATITATKDAPFVNSLGQEFVPAGTRGVLFCKWDTRVSDYRKFVNATDRDMSAGMYVMKVKGTDKAGYFMSWDLDATANWSNPGFPQSEAHPVVGVSLDDARAFCAWLTEKERTAGLLPAGAAYRLPKDEEWSAAVGPEKYPWGNTWPPKGKAGNYADASFAAKLPGQGWDVVPGLDDGWARTSPVGTYKPNRYGLFDMGGNVLQWCEDGYQASLNSAEAIKAVPGLKEEKARDGTPYQVLRGAGWDNMVDVNLRSAYRSHGHPLRRNDLNGFRCVLALSGS